MNKKVRSTEVKIVLTVSKIKLSEQKGWLLHEHTQTFEIVKEGILTTYVMCYGHEIVSPNNIPVLLSFGYSMSMLKVLVNA